MSLSDVELRLSAVLNQHAEDAMERTNTEANLEALTSDVEQRQRRQRRIRIAGAAIVAAVTIGIIAFANTSNKPDSSGPTQSPDSTKPQSTTRPPETAAVAVATGFLEAYGTFERATAASYLANDAAQMEGWQEWNRWLEATQYKLLLGPCEETAVSADRTRVVCTYKFHCLGSDQLDLGPFADNTYTVLIEDNKIVNMRDNVAFMTNGFSHDMWEFFAYWVATTHPKDAKLMYADWPNQNEQATNDRAIALWDEHTQNYVDAVQDGWSP
jgi:hypothetical protein